MNQEQPMTLSQASTIQFLWMKVSDEIYDVTAKIMAHKKLGLHKL